MKTSNFIDLLKNLGYTTTVIKADCEGPGELKGAEQILIDKGKKNIAVADVKRVNCLQIYGYGPIDRDLLDLLVKYVETPIEDRE